MEPRKRRWMELGRWCRRGEALDSTARWVDVCFSVFPVEEFGVEGRCCPEPECYDLPVNIRALAGWHSNMINGAERKGASSDFERDRCQYPARFFFLHRTGVKLCIRSYFTSCTIQLIA